MQDELCLWEQVVFEEYKMSCRHIYHPTDAQLERANFESLAWRIPWFLPLVMSWPETAVADKEEWVQGRHEFYGSCTEVAPVNFSSLGPDNNEETLHPMDR